MTRLTCALAMAVALVASGGALAQDGRISIVGSPRVVFEVTPDAIARASECPSCEAVEPVAGSPVVLEVTRQNPHRLYTIDVLHDGWTAAGELALEARYTVTTADGRVVLLVVDWLPVATAPTLAFTQAAAPRESRVRVLVEYRLRLRGDEPPGSFATRVVHRVRENGHSVVHEVHATLPSYLTLRLVGRTPGHSGTFVAFDYADAPYAYLDAATSGSQLAPTEVGLLRVEVGTNDARGFTVLVRVTDAAAPGGATEWRERLWLGDGPAHGRRFVGAGPTDGVVTVATGADYGLRIDGGERPGFHQVTVTFEVFRNP